MTDDSVLGRIIFLPTEAQFKQEKAWLVTRWLVISTVVIFTIETLVMVFLKLAFSIPHNTIDIVLDGLILAAFLFPLNYWFVVKPMTRQAEGYFRTNRDLLKYEEQIQHLYRAEIRARQLAETLHSSSLELARSLNSGTVLETLLEQLFKMVHYTSAHILLFDTEDQLVVRVARGEEAWDAAGRLLGRHYELSDLPCLVPLLREREILVVQKARNEPNVLFEPVATWVGSWLGVPLLASEQVIGVCILEHRDGNYFEEDLRNWASALTSQAAVAIQNAWLFEQVRDNRERLQALSHRLVDVQESERHYIARELHDEAGQALASLMLGLGMMERESGSPEKVEARCRELKQVADGVLENLHRLAIDLRPACLDHLGLVAALRQHTERVRAQHNLEVRFETVGKIERLSGEAETAIYRIVQEALTNVIRHAQATRVDILLKQRDDQLIVVVEDNGVGFNPQARAASQLGVVGIRERADMLGGAVTIESAPGKGSTIILEVPCQYAY